MGGRFPIAIRRFARLGVIGLLAGLAPAQAAETDLVRVSASGRYQAERVHRFLLGGGYRDLWTAEIELPVLNLQTTGGGLTPIGRFGGLQTAVLGLVGRDGRSYSFRGTDKDPSAVLSPLLQDTLVHSMVQDQMAAQHPAGPIASSVLSEAAGLLTVHERMVVMPDDPALGKYRAEFAGMVGTFFEFPQPASEKNPGFHDASEIIDHEELYERLARGRNDPVAADAFLRARLFDILIGDFDRHRKQWRWARLPGDPRWQPIPEDRDMAFVRYEGVGPRAASIYVPILQNYGPEYPRMQGLTEHGWEQDRWLLPALSWEEWEPVARDLQARITDATIDEAVAALPPPYVELDGERLREDLRGRRDRLLEGARAYYEHLAGNVDVQTSDAADQITVTRESDGSMRVEARALDDAVPGEPFFSRRFDPDDTRAVRIYLRDGDDRIVVRGAPGPIRLRLIAGGGQKRLDDSQGGGTRLYDEQGAVAVTPGPGTSVDDRPYQPPESDAGFVDVEDVPPKDWGSDTIPLPLFGYQRDTGVLLGVGVIHTRYGFRKHPWSSQHHLAGGYATEAESGRVGYLGSWRPENSNLLAKLDVSFSGIEVLRFYGFGNDTKDNKGESFYRVRNRRIRAAPSLQFGFHDDQVRLSVGPWIEHSKTKNDGRLINRSDPYGSGRFGSIGALANLQLDTRRSYVDPELDVIVPLHENPAAGYPTTGFLVDVTTELSPPVWDVEKTWGAIEGSITGYLSMGERDRATLALRVGGRETWGKTPYFKAAVIGGGRFFSGGSTVRGLRSERFLGDSSFFTNLDLRVTLGRLKLIVPGDFGMLGFGDVGRVFENGESSKKWHPGGGGGVWFAPLARSNAISFSVARSQEETLVYLRTGFAF